MISINYSTPSHKKGSHGIKTRIKSKSIDDITLPRLLGGWKTHIISDDTTSSQHKSTDDTTSSK
jgi:hypothetical protein